MSSVLSQSVSALNMQLRTQLLGGPQLVRDYYQGAEPLAPFFAGYPWDADALARTVTAVRNRFSPETRRALADAVVGTTDRANAKLEAIAAGDGFFVTTGQQAGLFSGPLFTVYKTLAAIKLAETLESQIGVPVAPLFWIAADDHDFAEVNHTYVIGTDNDLHRLGIDGATDSNQSMARRLLGDEILDVVAELKRLLPANEFSEQALAWIQQSYVPGRTMADAFGGLIAQMFAQHDLLITSSAHYVVKSLATPIILRELEQSSVHEATVRSQTDKLLAAGYHEQVSVRERAAHVLYEDEHGRDRLVREDGNWYLSRTKRTFTNAELQDDLVRFPERFSPNVLLRPVVASAVFPTLAYVGGPAEISYFAQIGCLFEAHDVAMPLVLPRASFEIIEHKVQKVLDKFGLAPEAFRQPIDQVASQVARDELPAEIAATLGQLRDRIAADYAALVTASESIDPTLRGPLENARNASHKALNDVEKKIVSHLKKKNEVGLEQLRKASASLYPDSRPQERVLSAVSFLARYGPAFLDAVAEQIHFELNVPAPQWRGVRCG